MKTAASQNGRVSKTVSVFTDAAGAESLRLRFTVDIRMPIEALPSFRFVLNTIEGKDSNDRILLRRTDGEAAGHPQDPGAVGGSDRYGRAGRRHAARDRIRGEGGADAVGGRHRTDCDRCRNR